MPPALRERALSPRANRSQTAACDWAGIPGPSSVTVSSASCRVFAAPGRRSRLCPSACALGALVSRFASTWCSRCWSPVTVTGSTGRSRTHLWPRARDACVVGDVDREPGKVNLLVCERPARIELASSSRSSTSLLIRADSASTRLSARRSSGSSRRPRRAAPAPCTRGCRRAGCAAHGWRRRRTGAAAPRWPGASPSACSTWPSIRLNASPSWPTSVRGSAPGTRCGSVTSPLARGI